MTSTAFDSAEFKANVEHLKEVAAASTDRCIIATLVAVRDDRVESLIAKKAQQFVWKGLFCEPRLDGAVAVVFNFDCPPGKICLVKPWFAAVVDLDLGVVRGVQDPYQPESKRTTNCSCAKPSLAKGCDSEASASLKNVRIEGVSVKGEVWARLKVSCSGVGSVIDFDDKLFDFEVARDGGSVQREFNVACAHLVLKVYITTSAQACVHWDITGCEVNVLGRKIFDFDEHAETCVSL